MLYPQSRLLLALAVLFSWPTSLLSGAIITNGDFKTGDLTGWTLSGNGGALVLNALGSIVSRQGMFFALLHNGPGDVDNDGLPDMGVLTSAPFIVPSNGGKLDFSYNFLTAEFTGAAADPSRLDSFSIFLIPSLGTPLLLKQGDVSQFGFTLIAGNPVSATDGSSFIEQTGLQSLSTMLIPGTYTLQFRVADAGDGSFDSGLIFDNVTVSTTSTAVPEPGTGLIFGVSVLGFLSLAKMFREKNSKE